MDFHIFFQVLTSTCCCPRCTGSTSPDVSTTKRRHRRCQGCWWMVAQMWAALQRGGSPASGTVARHRGAIGIAVLGSWIYIKLGQNWNSSHWTIFFGVIFRSMNLGANLMSLTYYSMSLSDFHHEIDIWTCNCQISGGKWDVGGLIQPTSD